MASCPDSSNIKISLVSVKKKRQMSHVLAVIAVCLIAGGGGIAIAMVTHFSINEDSKMLTEVRGTQSPITTPNIITPSSANFSSQGTEYCAFTAS